MPIRSFYAYSGILIICLISSFVFSWPHVLQISSQAPYEETIFTVTDEDFRTLIGQREQGLAGFHHNVDSIPLIPAKENAVLNWSTLNKTERQRLIKEQEKMFRQGKVTMIVMAGGEATRFGGPKPFVRVSEDLGDFLQIKAANLHWIRKTYSKNVPLYILSSEKRLLEFKTALAKRNYYGLHPQNFRWFSQGTVDTFIPSAIELKAYFQGNELENHLNYAAALHRLNPDGIYRFKGERRKVPSGHFDTITGFIISGLFSEALKLGIEFALVVNIDNLQAILKNDGMIAYFAEKDTDFGFILAEKNLNFRIEEKETGKVIENKLIVRFRDRVLSFDGIEEFIDETEKNGYRYVLDSERKAVNIYDRVSGRFIETKVTITPDIGGTLVQPANDKGEPIGQPILKEGFQLPPNFDHVNTPFFNTNTIMVNLRHLLKFLEISEEQLAQMNFEERSILVRKKLISQVKPNFEFKNHEVEGKYPLLGTVKNGKTKILVTQMTRIMLQATHLRGAKVTYIFAPRSSVYAPVKDPEDKKSAAEIHRESLKQYLLLP